MERTIKFWNDVAQRYARAPIKDPDGYAVTLERTRSYLGREDRVLEIGAGSGATALELAPGVAHVTATDISPAMSEIGRTRAREAGIGNIDMVTCAADVPGLDGPYDAVLAHNILHLVEDLPGTLARVHEVLKPGGVFVSKTFCRPGFPGPLTYYATRLALPVMQLVGKAPFVAFLRVAELEAAIVRSGFKIVESGNYPARETRRYIVARRI